MQDETIGFVGLGNMGSLMAANLVRAGYQVTAFDLDAGRRHAFADEHGTRCPEAATDLADASLIVTMVPTGAAVRATLWDGGAESLARRLRAGTVVIDTTSSPPESTRALGAELAELGLHLIDAPVSGGRKGAREGDLVFMLGGDDEAAIGRASEVLRVLGPRIFRLGALGSGHVMKSMNNYVSAAGYVAACEALIIGGRLGLDPATMLDVLNVSTGRNFATETSMKRVLAGDRTRNFALDLFTKDIRIALDLAEESEVHAPLIEAVLKRMEAARDAIGGHGDHTTAYSFWEGQAGDRR